MKDIYSDSDKTNTRRSCSYIYRAIYKIKKGNFSKKAFSGNCKNYAKCSVSVLSLYNTLTVEFVVFKKKN